MEWMDICSETGRRKWPKHPWSPPHHVPLPCSCLGCILGCSPLKCCIPAPEQPHMEPWEAAGCAGQSHPVTGGDAAGKALRRPLHLSGLMGLTCASHPHTLCPLAWELSSHPTPGPFSVGWGCFSSALSCGRISD